MDERLQYHYNSYKSLMGDKWDEAKIMEYAKFMADKEKTIKKGKNVLHINYLSSLLSNDDLEEVELELEKIGFELSSYDKTGVIYNSFEELTSVVRQILSSDATQDILIGLVGSAVWDGLCKVWALTYKKIKGKQITKLSSGGKSTTKDATVSIVFNLNQTTSVEYNLKGDFENESEALETFKNIIENAKSLPISETIPQNIAAVANFDNKSVNIIDEEKFIQDKIAMQNKKRKDDQREEES